jgi:hypothetical protein
MQLNINIEKKFDSGAFACDAAQRGKGLVRTDLRIKPDKLSEFLCQEGLTIHDSRSTDKKIICVGIDVELLIYSDNGELILCYAEHAGFIKFINRFSEYFENFSGQKIEIDYFYKDNYGIQQRLLPLGLNDFNEIIPELYPDIDIVRLYDQYMGSKDSVLFLTGEPGVGKTSFIKYLLKTCLEKSDKQIKAAYIKDIEVLQSSETWVDLKSKAYDIVLLDDLDFVLCTRSPEDSKSSIVNNLLSYSDGVLARAGKVIITSNMEIKDIDPALTRPGRCFDFLELNALTGQEARSIWKTRLEANGNFPALLETKSIITQAELMSAYFEHLSMSAGRTYRKRPGDRRLQDINKKRLGFGQVA